MSHHGDLALIAQLDEEDGLTTADPEEEDEEIEPKEYVGRHAA